MIREDQLDRRTMMLSAAVPVIAAFAPTVMTDPAEVIPLWPGAPPGAPPSRPQERIVDRSTASGVPDRAVSNVGRPTLTIFRPARPNGAALLIIPGGGYVRLVVDKEGAEPARRFNAAGVTAFVLRHRLPGEGWAAGPDAPLQDTQRALRLIRDQAARFHISRDRVGVLGFSAGGHLAASLATRYADSVYPALDGADRQSARPDLVGLIYPLTTMSDPHAHRGSRDALLGPDATEARRDAYSPTRRTRPDTPPTFLTHASDDGIAKVENSLLMFGALREQGVSAELHVFRDGGHGFGVRLAPEMPAAAWPNLFLAWTRHLGFSS